MLATCGVRKLLDFVFTQRELFWLDDILPSKHAEKKKHQMLKEEQDLLAKKKKEKAGSIDSGRKHIHHTNSTTNSGDDGPNYFQVRVGSATSAGSGESAHATAATVTKKTATLRPNNNKSDDHPADSSPK